MQSKRIFFFLPLIIAVRFLWSIIKLYSIARGKKNFFNFVLFRLHPWFKDVDSIKDNATALTTPLPLYFVESVSSAPTQLLKLL